MSEPSKPQGRKFQLPEHLKVYKDVWVIVEQERGQVHSVSLELLGEARKLADKLGVEVGAVVLGEAGPDLERICGDAFARHSPSRGGTSPPRCSPRFSSSSCSRR